MTEKTVTGEIRAIGNLMRRRMEKQRIGCPYGYILHFLSKNADKNVYQKDIKKEFSIRPATATQALNQLEREGYIKREISKTDGRLKKIALTPKGMEMDEKAKCEIDKTESLIRKNLSDSEIEQFFNLTAKIIDGFDENADK